MDTEPVIEISVSSDKELVPEWFGKYVNSIREKGSDLLAEINKLSTMKLAELNMYLGGNVDSLPYELLNTLFINGSDDLEVGAILSKKREGYVKLHPKMTRGVPEIERGIITYNGSFIPQSVWETATDSEKRGALVGSTCFHYNSGTPGMDSKPTDRW